jgi:copper resistance protein B
VAAFPIPPLTDTDRAAAFPDLEFHAMSHNAVHTFVLLDQLEWQGNQSESGMNWDAIGWIGGDRNRLWFRTEGEFDEGRLDNAEAHLLYGRAFARWWDVVVGVRQDVRPGPTQTWGAFGVHGLAPYWFEVEATGYVSNNGQTAAHVKVTSELLVTNRLILQPLVEVNLYGKSTVERGIGAGLSSTDISLRLRYEFRREMAPYIGVTWKHTFGKTRDLAKASGHTVSRVQFVAGLRLWY